MFKSEHLFPTNHNPLKVSVMECPESPHDPQKRISGGIQKTNQNQTNRTQAERLDSAVSTGHPDHIRDRVVILYQTWQRIPSQPRTITYVLEIASVLRYLSLKPWPVGFGSRNGSERYLPIVWGSLTRQLTCIEVDTSENDHERPYKHSKIQTTEKELRNTFLKNRYKTEPEEDKKRYTNT